MWYLDLGGYLVSITTLFSFKRGLTSTSSLCVYQYMNNEHVIDFVVHRSYFIDLDSFS